MWQESSVLSNKSEEEGEKKADGNITGGKFM